MSTQTVFPVQVTGRLDTHLSRWLWLVKWLLALPHYLVLALLWPVFVVTSVVAAVAILFTGRYPRALFELNAGVLRWTWRVAYYSYGALGTDEYPPFTLRDVPAYPARLVVERPAQLSRGLVLVKWLLAVPHFLVLALLLGGGAWAVGTVDGYHAETGLIGLLVLLAGVALLFTGRYPTGLFDLVLGLNRWVLRVAAYAGLMTDAYPPFRLDMGGDEPSSVSLAPPPAQPAPGPAAPGRDSDGTGSTVALVLGALLVLPGLGLTAGGGALLWADTALRDSAGYVTSERVELSTASRAVVTEPVRLHLHGPDELYVDDLVGEVRLRATTTGDDPVFVGVARAADVRRYLTGVDHVVLTEVRDDASPRYAARPGTEGLQAPPGEQGFWVASAAGTGTQQVSWSVEDGSWSVVVMAADGSAGVEASVDAGATLPVLDELALGLLAAGLVAVAGAAVLLVIGARGR